MRVKVEGVAEHGNIARSAGTETAHPLEGGQVYIGEDRFKDLTMAGDEAGGRFAPGPHKRTYAGASEDK